MIAIGHISRFFMLAGVLACATGNPGEPDARTALGRPGDACQQDSDCAGIPCADNVCCNTACAGVCEACNLPDSVGTCTAVPDGEDPDDDCSYLGCDGYFRGWNDNSCHQATGVTDDQATCNGARACRSAEQECAASTPGPTAAICNSICQVPDAATCTGMTAGTCINVDQGMTSCGQGACQVTVPVCDNGQPNVCTPDDAAESPEVCNGVDDDCDGLVDDDWAEPNESCADYQNLVTIFSQSFQEYRDLSVSQAGDTDYFRIVANENDASCACCDGAACTDEDYQFLLYLTAPAGAGTYRFCSGRTCGSVDSNCVDVPAGQNRTLTWNLDGSCAATDSFELFVRVHGTGTPGYACAPYYFAYEFVTGCYGAPDVALQ